MLDIKEFCIQYQHLHIKIKLKKKIVSKLQCSHQPIDYYLKPILLKNKIKKCYRHVLEP